MNPRVDLLYYAPGALRSVVAQQLGDLGGRPPPDGQFPDRYFVNRERRTYQIDLCADLEQALRSLGGHYFNFVIVDARDCDQPPGYAGSAACRFFERIRYAADPDLRYPLSRVVAVLPGGSKLAEIAFAVGREGVGSFVVAPLSEALWSKLDSLRDRDPGKAAICLSGGGLEGFLFEVGVMKALNSHLQVRSVCDADIFCGISAGAILAAFLANGTSPEEVERAFTDPQADGIEPVTPAVVYDIHYREYAARILSLARNLPITGWSDAVSSVLKTVPIGFFRGDALERFVETQLLCGGRSNDFRQLDKQLYIGATDQDTSTHVVFGDGQWRDVPISSAVRASAALTPLYEPTKIRGRYFVDGQYTRTCNLHLAIERGAKLVVIVDPLVPIRVDVPGYVRKKGGLFAALQALKAVVHTRFAQAFQSAVESYPHVDFVLFSPEGSDVRLLSGSPMRYTIRTEILDISYRYAVRRIQRDFEILKGTFGKHGFELQRQPRLRTPHRPLI